MTRESSIPPRLEAVRDADSFRGAAHARAVHQEAALRAPEARYGVLSHDWDGVFIMWSISHDPICRPGAMNASELYPQQITCDFNAVIIPAAIKTISSMRGNDSCKLRRDAL